MGSGKDGSNGASFTNPLASLYPEGENGAVPRVVLTEIQLDVDERQRISVAIAQAIQDAEASSISADTEASAAYDSLRFDFPSCSSSRLIALSDELRTTLQEGKLRFPLTNQVLSGILHLSQQHNGPTMSSGNGNRDPPFDGNEADGNNSSATSVQEIAAIYLVKLPPLILHDLKSAHSSSLLSALQIQPSAWKEGDREEQAEQAENSEGETAISEEGNGELISNEQDNDDAEWEPLDAPPVVSPAGQVSLSGVATCHSVVLQLHHLSRVLRFDLFKSPKVWESLRLVESVVSVVKALLALIGQGVSSSSQAGSIPGQLGSSNDQAESFLSQQSEQSLRDIVRAYVGLLQDAFLSFSGGEALPIRRRISEAISELFSKAEEPAHAFGQQLKVSLLGGLSRGGGVGALLWREVDSVLEFLESRMNERSELEDLASIFLCFVKEAPGNADVGRRLLESGVWRAAVRLAVKAMSAFSTSRSVESYFPQLMDFVLYGTVASRECAKYASGIPGLKTAISEGQAPEPWGMLLRLGMSCQLSYQNSISNEIEVILQGYSARLAPDRPLDWLTLSSETSKMWALLTKLEFMVDLERAQGRSREKGLLTAGLKLRLVECQVAVRVALSRMGALRREEEGLEKEASGKEEESTEKDNVVSRKGQQGLSLLAISFKHLCSGEAGRKKD